MYMDNLQKIVVLCVVLGVGVFIGLQFAGALPGGEATTQIDPPSLELETGPEDVDTEDTEGPDTPVVVTPAPAPSPEPDMVACTMDAKMCPDGSFVGRVGPDCEFAACPSEGATSQSVVCTNEMKQAEACTMEYAPVCGLVQVQCFTEPCNPVPETFSNGCSACAQGNVISYTQGQCSA